MKGIRRAMSCILQILNSYLMMLLAYAIWCAYRHNNNNNNDKNFIMCRVCPDCQIPRYVLHANKCHILRQPGFFALFHITYTYIYNSLSLLFRVAPCFAMVEWENEMIMAHSRKCALPKHFSLVSRKKLRNSATQA